MPYGIPCLLTLLTSLARADNAASLLIAPHISGQSFCKAAVDDPSITNEEAASTYCTQKAQDGAERINAALDRIGPEKSPSGKFELGYTLNLPLMRFYRLSSTGAWSLDFAAIENAVRIIHDVNRPVVVYLSANHFTDGGIPLSNKLAEDSRNLMWTKSGPLQAYNYFVVSLHAWTLIDEDAPITVMRRRAFTGVLDAICKLDQPSRVRIRAVSVLGEVHQLWGHYDAGQGDAAGYDITDYSPKAVQGFHDYLRSRFGNIASLNKFAGSAFHAFDEVAPPSKDIRRERLNSFFEHIDAFAAGFVPVHGWAFDPSGAPVRIAIYLDGKQRGEVRADLNRSDVPDADPKIGTPNVGWRYDLDYRSESNGIHTLEVFRLLADGSKIRLTRRLLAVVPRDQSPTRPLPTVEVDARDADSNSVVRAYVDAPAQLTSLFYNPVAAWWLDYRNKVVRHYVSSFASLVGESCLPQDIIFSHQIMPELNSSWNADLMAVNASQEPNTAYKQGTTLYGGAAWGQAFFDWKNAHGWTSYAVSELNPRFALTLAGFVGMLNEHRENGAAFVAPYFISIAPPRLRRPFTEGLNRMTIDPANTQLGSDTFYRAISHVMHHD